ncbi:Hint domain-containing protein [Actibacterium sp. MT2.3-13A]|uniref:Hint domain-containing protein n=1 Tax=Actibacterium sp. MT2.3-13A TaxID=2828332 RepID=UPI001BA90850|nr:Hint domain-containing protein [Actibacterium sp. MT2.3-13A]
MPLTRRYEVAGLTPSGQIDSFTRVAPATPAFEDAFAGFARGTLIQTPRGPVAVEDLVPGIPISVDGEDLPLLWVGSMTVFPNLPEQPEENGHLTRITADAFGLGRPMPDLLLGARARLMFRHSRCEALLGRRSAFAPARAFIDGMSAIQITPAAPVAVFHLALERQAVLRANGVEVESFHPGTSADQMMGREALDLLLSLFPHARGLSDFGPMPYPRLTAFELEGMRAA